MNGKNVSPSLKKTEVIPLRYCQTTVTYNTILVWKIPDFEKISTNVIHYQVYENENKKGILRVFKHKNLLHLSVSSASIFKNVLPEFSIISEKNKNSITEKAIQISDGIYVGKFMNEQFLSSDSNFLSKGTLTITFKYVSDYFALYREVELEAPEKLSNCDELCYDLKTMYLEAIHPDFLIHVNEYAFKCHKIILASRSFLFYDLLKLNKNEKEYRMPNDVLPGIMHEVLLYMYSGELMEMNPKCIVEVFKIAVFLKIKSLLQRLLVYFNTQFCKKWERNEKGTYFDEVLDDGVVDSLKNLITECLCMLK